MNNRGAVTLVFDDGYTNVYDQVLTLLEKYNIHAVFAVPMSPKGQQVEGEAIAPIIDWQNACKKYGHELAGHGVMHKNLVKLSKKALETELREPAEKLRASTIVYPGGAVDEYVKKESAEWYSAGRSVKFGLETLPPQDVMELRTLNFTKNNFSVARANIYTLLAYAQNKWLIETYHMVSDTSSGLTHSVLLSDLEAHLDFVTSLPIRIATIREITKSL